MSVKPVLALTAFQVIAQIVVAVIAVGLLWILTIYLANRITITKGKSRGGGIGMLPGLVLG